MRHKINIARDFGRFVFVVRLVRHGCPSPNYTIQQVQVHRLKKASLASSMQGSQRDIRNRTSRYWQAMLQIDQPLEVHHAGYRCSTISSAPIPWTIKPTVHRFLRVTGTYSTYTVQRDNKLFDTTRARKTHASIETQRC